MAKNGRELIATDDARPLGFRPATAPILPASSGAWFGSPTTLLAKDTKFVETHTKYLQARQQQLVAADNLIAARNALELTTSRLANIEAIKQHEFKRGVSERERELVAWQNQQELDTIQHATTIAEATTARLKAETARLAAEAALAEQKKVQPPPAAPAAPPPAIEGLTPADVEGILQRFPDLKPELIEPIIMTLRGFLAEKKEAP